MKHPFVTLASAALLVTALAGCGTTSSLAASTTHGPKSGGVAVYALQPQTSPNWFFPLRSLVADTVINAQTSSMLYKPLLYFNKNDQLDYQHSLARSVTWNSSGTVYTIKLNPKWHWSNGHPVTSKDVVFTWSIMKAASLPNSHYDWTFSGQGFGGIPDDWKSVVATGKYTVQVTTTKPRNPQWFIRNGLDEIIPVPEAVWNKFPHNMTKEMAFINSVANSPLNSVYRVVDGPYRLSAYQANNYWDFVPNPHYDGHKSYLKKVVFQYQTSTTEQFASLKAGTVNVGYLGVSLLSSKKLLTHDTMTVAYPMGFNYIMLNLNPDAPGGTHIGSAFQELPVRQALQYGVDQAGIIKTIFHGYGTIDDGPLAPQPSTSYVDPTLSRQPYPFNLKRGKEMLLKNGWHEVNGVMTKGNMKLEFTLNYASGSQSGADEMQLLKSDWAQEGIVVNLDEQPFDTVASDSQENSTKWAAAYWGQGNIGGWTYGNPYPSGGGLFATNGAENGGGYNNRTMDALIQKTYEPGTEAQTLQALYKYETYTAEQLPGAIFVPWEPLFNVHANEVHDTVSTFNPIGDVIFPNYWWIS
jgi:peptide/nickel transport system substrate-binding protein